MAIGAWNDLGETVTRYLAKDRQGLSKPRGQEVTFF